MKELVSALYQNVNKHIPDKNLMGSDRTEVIVGATSRIAQKYIDYLTRVKNVSVLLVSRSGKCDFDSHPLVQGHIRQDLTSLDYSKLEGVLDKDNLRVVYFAGRSSPAHDMPAYTEINVEPVKRLIDIVSRRDNIFTDVSTYRVFGPREKDLSENARPFHQGNYYANSKRDGELVTLNYDHGQVVRLATVLGMKGDFLEEAVSKILKGEEAVAWRNVFSRFAWVNDACFVLNRAGEYEGDQRVFHVASPERFASVENLASRYGLARWFVETLKKRGYLPSEASGLLIPIDFDFKDGRRMFIDIETTITEKELGFVPTSIYDALSRSIELGYPFN